MILRLTQDMTRLALRIRDSWEGRQLTDWQRLQLLILPGQRDMMDQCGPNGSPWILTGCWPGKRTNVDVANWRPDFPALICPAFTLDADGAVVFRIDDRIHSLPPGRYTGVIRVTPRQVPPYDPHDLCGSSCKPLPPGPVLKPFPIKPDGKVIPPEYLVGAQDCNVDFPTPPPPPAPPPYCILAEFDIDLGPMCVDHFIDQASVDFSLASCGDE